MFAALTVPNFRRYVSGQSLSLIGTWVETVAQALLVLRLTHSGIALGLTTAARYAPILLLSPYAGLLVDRYAKRHVLLATQTGLGLVSAALGVSVLTGSIRLWQVVVLAVLFGIFSAVDNPARQAFVQEVVGRDLVRNAVTLNSTSVNVARVIGPTIAAILVSTVGLGWCFVVNAASFEASAPVAPGSLVSLFGMNLSAQGGSSKSVPLPFLLGDVSVTVGGFPAALVMVDPRVDFSSLSAE